MAKRVLLGKEGSNYVLKVSKPSVDVIDDTINDRDYLFFLHSQGAIGLLSIHKPILFFLALSSSKANSFDVEYFL